MIPSELVGSISDSPTLRLNQEARILRGQGQPVIHLGIGEPLNKAPMGAIQSAMGRLTSGDIKYSPLGGLPSLKHAIQGYTERNYGKLVGPENIIVCEGAKQTLFNLLVSIINPRDEVLIPTPYWVSYPELVRLCRGLPVTVPVQAGTFYPHLRDIERCMSARTKAIILNSPNNPSGAVYPEALVAELVEFCEKRSIYLIMDDIYHKLVFDGKVATSALRFAREDINASKVVVVNGVSKLYGMTGFRVGWAVAPKPIIEAMARVQSQTTSCVSEICQVAAEGALTGEQSVVEGLRQEMQDNRDLVLRKLKALRQLQLIPPEGTFYCFPDFRAYNQDSLELARFLLTKALVVTVPGRDFGMEGYLRLSYAGWAGEVSEGIDRIVWALDPDSPKTIVMGERTVTRDWL